MFRAACCLGFFAFLRSGEFTLPSGMSFDPQFHLLPDDLKVDSLDTPTQVFITIKASKTDQAGKGVTLCVGHPGKEICPVTTMLTSLALCGFSHGPLFVFQDGKPLFQPHFSKMLKAVVEAAGMDSKRYSGHSFRIGAATTAAVKGIADSTVQTLGCRASDSYRRYIRLQPEELSSYLGCVSRLIMLKRCVNLSCFSDIPKYIQSSGRLGKILKNQNRKRNGPPPNDSVVIKLVLT